MRPQRVDVFGEVSRRERRRTLPGVRRRVPVHDVLRGASGVNRGIRLGLQRARRVRRRGAPGTRSGRPAPGSNGGSTRRSRRAGRRRAPRSRSRSPRRSRRPAGPAANSPPGCAPIGASQTASTRWAGIRTWSDHARRSSTTRSTVTIAPRRAPSAPHTPSSNGGATATLPARSATGACRIATSACSGARRPTGPKGVVTSAKASFSAIDEPVIERVVTAGNPRAPASSRCANARNDQCSTSTAPEV